MREPLFRRHSARSHPRTARGQPARMVHDRTMIPMRPLLACALLAVAAPARAEVIQLVDNTQVAGKILHYYDGVFQVEAAGGQKVDIPRDKIKSITFKLP